MASRHGELYGEFVCSTMRRLVSERQPLYTSGVVEPFSDEFFASVLLADVSGFTRLASKKSAEELRLHINNYFTQMLNIIDDCFGDVVKFCGDAVIVVWPVDVDASEEVKSAAVTSSITCARKLIKDCSEGNLALHCGIACGIVHFMCLGKHDRWEFVVSGYPLQQMGDAEAEANLGEVVISPDAFELAKLNFTGKVMPKGNYLISGIRICSAHCEICLSIKTGKFTLGRKSIRNLQATFSQFRDVDFSIHPRHVHTNLDTIQSEKYEVASSDKNTRTISSRRRKSVGISETVNESILENSSNDNSEKEPYIHEVKDLPSPSDDIVTDDNFPSSSQSPPSIGIVKADSSGFGGCFSNIFRCLRSSRASDSYSLKSSPSPSAISGDGMFSNNVTANYSTNSSSPSSIRVERPGSYNMGSSFALSQSDIDEHDDDKNTVNTAQSVHSNSSNTFASTMNKDGQEIQMSQTYPQGRRRSSFMFLNGFTFQSSTSINESSTPVINIENENESSVSVPLIEDIDDKLSPEESRTRHHGEINSMLVVKNFLELFRKETIGHQPFLNKFSSYFVPKNVRLAVEGKTIEFLSELRFVVTVFIEIIGADDDFLEGDFSKPQTAIKCILSGLSLFGGGLRQFVVDDKGCVGIGAFGTPGHSHENDALLAVHAGIAIRRRLQAGNMDCKIGIARGRVYCGIVGSKDRCEYAMMGSSVNLAARLMGKCHVGQILVEHDVFQAASKAYLFEELPKIRAKGYKSLIAVYSPVRLADSVSNELLGSNYNPTRTASMSRIDYRSDNSVLSDLSMSSLKSSTKISAAGTDHKAETKQTSESHRRSFIRPPPKKSTRPTNQPFIGHDQELREFRLAWKKFLIDGNFQAHIITGPMGSGKSFLMNKLKNDIFISSKAFQVLEYKATASISSQRYECLRDLLLQAFVPIGISHSSFPRSHSEEEGTDHRERRRKYAKWDAAEEAEFDVVSIDDIEKSLQDWFSLHVTPEESIKVQFDASHSASGTPKTPKSTRAGNKKFDFQLSQREDSFKQKIDYRIENEFRVSRLMFLFNPLLKTAFPKPTEFSDIRSSDIEKLSHAFLTFMIAKVALMKPLIIMLDHFGWCDIPSVSVLTQLVKLEPSKIMMICTSDEARGTQIIPIIQETSTTTRGRRSSLFIDKIDELDPLIIFEKLCTLHKITYFTIDDIKALAKVVMADAVGHGESYVVSDENAEIIADRTGSNPALVYSLLIALHDSIKNHKNSDLLWGLNVSENIVTSFFDRLSDLHKLILKFASVIGPIFSFSDLCSLMMSQNYLNSPDDVRVQLELLKQDGILGVSFQSDEYTSLLLDEDDGTSMYRFSNPSVQEAIYNILLKDFKASIHGSIARNMESKLSSKPNLIEMVTFHYTKSDNVVKKMHYLREVVEYARLTRNCQQVLNHSSALVRGITGYDDSELLLHCIVSPHYNTNYSSLKSDKQTKMILKRQHSIHSMYGNWMSIERFLTPMQPGVNEVICYSIADISGAAFRLGMLKKSYNSALFALHGNLFDPVNCIHQNLGTCDIGSQDFDATPLAKLNMESITSLTGILIQIAIIYLFSGLVKEAQGALQQSVVVTERMRQISSADLADFDKNLNNDFAFPADYLRIFDLRTTLLQICSRILSTTRSVDSAGRTFTRHPKVSDAAFASFLTQSRMEVLSYSNSYDKKASSPNERKQGKISSLEYFTTSNNIDDSIKNTKKKIINLSELSNNFSSPTTHDKHDELRNDLHTPVAQSEAKASDIFYKIITDFDDALKYMAHGHFDHTFTIMGKVLTGCISFDSNGISSGSSFRQLALLQCAWIMFLSGSSKRAQVILSSVIDLSRQNKQSEILSWGLELAMFLKLFCSKYIRCATIHELEEIAAEIKQLARLDRPTASVAAMLSFAYFLEGNNEIAIQLSQYAVGKLSQKASVTPNIGIYLFVAGYTSANIVEQLTKDDIDKKDSTPRHYCRAITIVRKVLDTLSQFCNAQPCLQLLFDGLNCKFFSFTGKTTSAKVVAKLIENIRKSHLYEEFVFGRAVLEFEIANLLCKLKVNVPKWGSPHIVNTCMKAAERNFALVGCPSSTYWRSGGRIMLSRFGHINENEDLTQSISTV